MPRSTTIGKPSASRGAGRGPGHRPCDGVRLVETALLRSRLCSEPGPEGAPLESGPLAAPNLAVKALGRRQADPQTTWVPRPAPPGSSARWGRPVLQLL